MNNNFEKYNYLLSNDLGQMVKGTELEGLSILDSFVKVNKMDEETLRKLCMTDDLRLLEEGSFDKTLANIWLDEENNEIPRNQLIEILWSKKDKNELIDILFGADIDDSGIGTVKDLSDEVMLIQSNPKKYLLDDAYDDLFDLDEELLFNTEKHKTEDSKLNKKVANLLMKDMIASIEKVFKERLNKYLSLGEKSKELLKESIKNVQYKVDKGSFEIDLNLKDQGPHKCSDENNFYWEVKEESETYEEEDLDHSLFVVNFSGNIITEGLTIPVSHGVWVEVVRDENDTPISFQLFQTYV